jgi:hypothetical protein
MRPSATISTRLWRFKGESFVPHGLPKRTGRPIVLGLGDDCGEHQDLLINLDLKVPAFASLRPRGRSGGGRSGDSPGRAGEFPFLPRTGLSSARSPLTATLSTMDTPNPAKAAHLLDDLESIRQLLGDDNLQPPLLTERSKNRFRCCSTWSAASRTHRNRLPRAPTAPLPPPKSADALLHLDSELRAAAQLIMQDVIDDFAPHIETEIKRRLDARMERLLSQYQS